MVQVEEEKRAGGPEKEKKVRCVAIFFSCSKPKMKSMSSFTHLRAIPNFELQTMTVFFSMEHRLNNVQVASFHAITKNEDWIFQASERM